MTDFAKIQDDLRKLAPLIFWSHDVVVAEGDGVEPDDVMRHAADAIEELYTEIIRLEAKLRDEPCVDDSHAMVIDQLAELSHIVAAVRQPMPEREWHDDVRFLAFTIDRLWGSNAERYDKIKALEAMLREMTSVDGCTYDHNNYCQTHYRPGPCVHERARVKLGVEVLT